MAGGNFRRQALKKTTEATKRGGSIQWEEFTEQTLHETWMSAQFNKYKKLNTPSIGGQDPGQGPKVLDYLKKHDPQNASGPVKKALEIMMAADKAAESDKLMDFLKPIKQTLGGGLFSALQTAGAGSKAGSKMQKMKEEKEPVPDMLQELIQAAIECAGGEDALNAAELLTAQEIGKINKALDNNQTYASTVMPAAFVDCVNNLIPGFYATQEGATS